MIIEKLGLDFSESLNLTLQRLQADLACANDSNYVNLKEVRDYMLGYRVNMNCVFGWGLEDERLCFKSPPSG